MRAALLILSLVVSFSVVSAQEILFETDFENGLPTGVTADMPWSVGNASQLSSQFFAIPPHTNFIAVNDDAAGAGVSSNGRVISPEIDLSTVETAVLRFEVFFINGDYEGDDEQGKLLASTDGGENWEELINFDGVDDWQQILLPITDYVGDTIQIAFEYLDGGGWNYGMAVDDISLIVPARNEVELERLTINRFENLVGENAAISGVVTNFGIDTVNTLEVTWTIDGVSSTETIEGLAIPYGASLTVTHPEPFVPSEAITYDVTMSVDSPNGEMDADSSNNSVEGLLSGVTFRPAKKVVFEEGTGTWCGWCPRGFAAMAEMKERHPEKFIGIAVHNGDPMVLPEHDNNMGLSGYPGSNIDRVLNNVGVSTSLFEEFLGILDVTPPARASLSAEFNAETREVAVNTSTEFATRIENIDYRVSVVITEDSVVGTSASYDQANFYSSQAANIPLVGAGLDWQAEPDPVPASTMVYNETSRAILGGYNGEAGVIPANVEAGDVFEKTFTYTVPENYNWEQIHAVLLVLDNETGAIVNAETTTFDLVVNTEDVFANELVEVFPNPAQGDNVNIAISLNELTDVQLEVYNVAGQIVATRDLGDLMGEVTIPFSVKDLSAGVYSFRINMGERMSVKRVVVK